MRPFSGITVASLVFGLFVSNAALAQGQRGGGRGGRGGFGGGGVTFLLQSPDVQKELKLSEDQIAKLKEVADSVRPQRGNGGPNFRDMTEEQRTAFRAEQQKKNEEATKRATDLLTADQNGRLKQLQLWQQGIRALSSNEEVARELSLTDEQKSALKTISDESGKKRGELFQGLGRDASPEERTRVNEQVAAMRTESDSECMAVLTDDQKARFTTMKGAKPAFDLNAIGRGGPGGGRGARGRPGGTN